MLEERATVAGPSSVSVAGRVLRLSAASDDFAPLFDDVWLGTELWPAAQVLIRAMQEPTALARQLGRAAVVAELGAGTGACGLAAAALGAREVTLTDKESLVPALRANVTANQLDAIVTCEALEWSDGVPAHVLKGGADVVLMSDCLNPVYGERHAEALAAVLDDLLRRRAAAIAGEARAADVAPSAPHDEEPMGLLSQTRRGDGVAEACFWRACERLGLRGEKLMDAAEGSEAVTVHAVWLGAGGCVADTS